MLFTEAVSMKVFSNTNRPEIVTVTVSPTFIVPSSHRHCAAGSIGDMPGLFVIVQFPRDEFAVLILTLSLLTKALVLLILKLKTEFVASLGPLFVTTKTHSTSSPTRISDGAVRLTIARSTPDALLLVTLSTHPLVGVVAPAVVW